MKQRPSDHREWAMTSREGARVISVSLNSDYFTTVSSCSQSNFQLECNERRLSSCREFKIHCYMYAQAVAKTSNVEISRS